MILVNRRTTKQVHYNNIISQAGLKEEVYIEEPKVFVRKDKLNMILKLIKSMYGLKHASKIFFDNLRARILERGFIQFEIDKYLFIK